MSIVVPARPLALDELIAEGEGRCGTPPEEGTAIARLLECSRELLGEVIRTERQFPGFHGRIIREEPERPRAKSSA